MLGFVKRLSGEFRDPYTLRTLYVSLVRPKLEHINRIKRVQRKFDRYALRGLRWTHMYDTIRYLFFQCTTNHLIRIVNFDHFIEFGYEFKLFAINHLSGCIFEDLQQHLNHYGLV
jgi:hypothetical protein